MNGITRRVALGVVATLPLPALAQPVARPARIVLGFPAGSTVDILARLLAERLRGRIAPQIIVDNRPGAGGRLAAEQVKAMPPDGTAMFLTAASVLTVSPHGFPRSTRFDTLTDFVPVSNVASVALVMAVPAAHPARDLAGFMAWARGQPEVPDATPAAGTAAHFLTFEFARRQGLPLTHVTYRGAVPALADLIAGRLPMMVSLVSDVLPHLRSGAARGLAATSPARQPSLPDVPTFAELGFQEMSRETWWGMFLPAGAPPALVAELNAAIAEVMTSPDIAQTLRTMELTTTAVTQNPAQLREAVAAEFRFWGEIVRAAGFDGDAG
jgi:tripartite-type tricarboxylate transporter receptor subunit TctC